MVLALPPVDRYDSWCKSHSTNRQTASHDTRRTVRDPLLQALQAVLHCCRAGDTAGMAVARGMRMNAETLSSQHCPALSFVAGARSLFFLLRDGEKRRTGATRAYGRRGNPTERVLCRRQRCGRQSKPCDYLD